MAALAVILATALLAGPWTAWAAAGHGPGTTTPGRAAVPGGLRLGFETNVGQADGRFDFLARGHGYGLFLRASEAVLVLASPTGQDRRRAVVRMRLVGANPLAEAAGQDRLAGTSNYFLGDRPAGWRTGIPHDARVAYREVYPGTDLIYYGDRGRLEFDFALAPGADPANLRLAFEGTDGLRLDGDGNLVVAVTGGEIVEHAPLAYQEEDGRRVPVPARWVLHGPREAGLALGARDPDCRLLIDPVLVYSTYLGGGDVDGAQAIAVGAGGDLWVAGDTASTDFPTANPGQGASAGNGDAFVARLSADGATLVYASYLGGGGGDHAFGLAVDSAGSAYLTGFTDSTDFPTRSPLQAANAAGFDAFVSKLDATGATLVYSTYLGGDGEDLAYGVAVDPAGRAYVTGHTGSSDFPRVNPVQAAGAGSDDAFVSRLSANGSALDYSTYLGGSGLDQAHAIAVDPGGGAHVAGYTDSTDFPRVSPLQPANAGQFDAFVAGLSADGAALVYSTYLGGSQSDFAYGIALDPSGNIVIAGESGSTDFPTRNPVQAANAGWEDAFVARLDPGGLALGSSTYFGGGDGDWATAIALDAIGNAHVTGHTASPDFPTADPLQAGPGGGSEDGFVFKLDAAGSAPVYSTYLGGGAGDGFYAIAVDQAGDACLAGYSASLDFPTVAPLQPANAGLDDAVVARVSGAAPTCAMALAPVRALRAAKVPGARSDVFLRWQSAVAANGYNLWYVTAKTDIPRANQANQAPGGPANPVDLCAVPAPASGASCTDPGAVGRDPGIPYFYQVRVYCDAQTEGP